MKFNASTEIDATPDKAWALVSNFEEWPQWIPQLKKVAKVSDGPIGVGSQLLIVARFIITVKLLMTITKFVPGQIVVMEGKVLGTRMTRYYSLEPVGQRAKLDAGGNVSGPLSFMVRHGGQKLSETIAQALKERIETLIRSGADA
ncbi:MAG: SRPBCC family protein [Dehalococcoidia bacterium]|nr:SRPBCC family protein [Dehalococcoidia bacterium]